MNETSTTKKSEFVFRRIADSFEQFTADAWASVPKLLLAVFVVFAVARVVYRYANPAGRAAGARDATAFGVAWGLILWGLGVFGVLAAQSIQPVYANRAYEGFARYAAAGGLVLATVFCFAVVVAAVVLSGLGAYKYATKPERPAGQATGLALAWGSGLAFATLVAWWLINFYTREADAAKSTSEVAASVGTNNDVKWYAFTGIVLALGAIFVALMYVKDTRTVRWYFAAPLALLRMTVYAVLAVVFLLPSMQTWEDTNKGSRVVILIDITPSLTEKTDEIGTGPGKKPKTRMDVLIDFLSDDNVKFLKNLLEKNPVAIYAFGTRLDESPTVVPKGGAAFTREDWQAFARYDFRPHLIRGLSDAGKEQLKKWAGWSESNAGTASWASTHAAGRENPDAAKKFGLSDPADNEVILKNLEKLDKRIDVARTIALGTNVVDSVTAAVNREAPNMVQGVVVFSDGRSNLGSESGFAELRERATRERIPIFTVAVGEDRQTAAITISEVQAPDSAPIDEPWKVVVEADGVNMGGREVEVLLDLFPPGRDPKTAAPGHTLKEKMVFAPGDPPHGQAEFNIDAAKLPDTLTTDSKDAAIKKRVLLEGKWNVRARIAKDAMEAFADEFHVRERPDITVLQQKLRVLLIAGAPNRDFTFLRTLLVREVQDKRATLTTFVQNDAGTTGKLTPEQDETVILRFPNRYEVDKKKGGLPEEKPYNLDEYDVIIAFDPDWTELTELQAKEVDKWMSKGGGGLIYVAGSIHTGKLAPGKEQSERLAPFLSRLPVIPADIIARNIKGTAKTPRRLKLYPERITGSELLKLDDKVPNDPIAGWERFFTDRDKYVENKDLKVELYPERGFFSCYPVKEVKKTSPVLAEFVDVADNGQPDPQPWIVINNPLDAYRSTYLASAELYRLRAFDPEDKTGQEFFERFWVKMIKYNAAKRLRGAAARGRVLVGKEAVSGAPLRVQARILTPGAEPYAPNALSPKFKIVQESPNGDKRTFGPYDLAPKQNAAGAFDGYYAGQQLLDPQTFPPGDFLYRVFVDVPDSDEPLKGEFRVRKSDPEMDNTRPDFDALRRMASEFSGPVRERASQRAKDEFDAKLPKEGTAVKLAFKLTDKALVGLIPECMKTETVTNQNRGPVNDLWDRGFDMPTVTAENETVRKYLVSWWSGLHLSAVLLIVVSLLAVEWLARKLLRLA
ncbi:MAG: VWA domain-containing protein [Planctomycetes bacterium]|nr:VWA domain-containing protein [Planctomycetota bacterium]